MAQFEDERLLSVALDAARRAAELHRSESGRVPPEAWGEKGVADFVTEVDLAAERLILRSLRAAFPDHSFLAEEGTEEAAADVEEAGAGVESSPMLWIVDPLDGTTNWLHGYPEYAVSIAAADAGGLRLGVVINSATEDEYVALRGAGSRLNGEPIRVSELAQIRLSLLGTGFPFKHRELLPDYLGMLDRALRGTAGVRRAGAAALDLCAVARGRLDAFWEASLMPWDVAAGALIVREAGGFFGPLGLDAPPDSELGRVIEGARKFVDLRDNYVPASGAYMAANGHLAEPLRTLLAG